MKTIVLCVAYDGTNYSGLQNQKTAPTIQEELERAMQQTCGYHAHVIAAGRTDAGVHAQGMVTHSRVRDDWAIPEHKIRLALNSRLPRDIRVMGAQFRNDDRFHARFDAIAREYTYTVCMQENPLTRLYCWQPRKSFDVELLADSAILFRGEHDFTTFSKLNEDVSSYICTVDICEWTRIDNQTLQLRIKANRFVYGMVRALTGAMMDAARGKRTLDELADALAARDRSLSSPMAPAQGLVFEQAHYPEELQLHFT